MSEYCITRIFDGWHEHQCRRKKKVGEFCKQHDPVTVKARQNASQARWKAELAAKKEARDRPIREAVAEERERCAKIANSRGCDCEWQCGNTIADLIRKDPK